MPEVRTTVDPLCSIMVSVNN